VSIWSENISVLRRQLTADPAIRFARSGQAASISCCQLPAAS
jgi:hypothetical protein